MAFAAGTFVPVVNSTVKAAVRLSNHANCRNADTTQSGTRRLQVMLLSDGSVTRHLQLLTGLSVTVECLQMLNIGPASADLPAPARMLQGPLVQRQVPTNCPQPTPSNVPSASNRTPSLVSYPVFDAGSSAADGALCCCACNRATLMVTPH
jgi:hypothetical protein